MRRSRLGTIGRRTIAALSLMLVLAMLSVQASEHEPRVPASLGSHMSALIETLPPVAQRALQRVGDEERKLLALRAYIRAGAELPGRWTWTARQVGSFKASAEYERLLMAVQAVTDEFERRNPGYSLYTNLEVRTLAVQLERWNENPRVGRTARELWRAAERELARRNYPNHATPQSRERFEQFLRGWIPHTPAPLAAPGLSAHGQLRAIDFQIVRNGAVVAGPEVTTVESVWERGGWREKLHAAVVASGAPFRGPLAVPNEPWHYTYVGEN
jgi:hypothetical protein